MGRVTAITAGRIGSEESQAEGHGDSSGSPQVQVHVKTKGSEIKREILGRCLVAMPVPESLQL